MSRCVRYAGYIQISKKRKNSDRYHKSSFSCMLCAVSCSGSMKLFYFFMQSLEKETQLGNYVLCAKSDFVRLGTACYLSLKTTTTRGLIVGFFDVNMSVNHYPIPLSAADTISSAGTRVGPGSPPPLPKEAVTN